MTGRTARSLLYVMPGSEFLHAPLQSALGCEQGMLELHHFPDGECCPRLGGLPAGRDLILAAALDQPDEKIIGLYLAACVARELGARSVGLVLPYLPYMRQDARFRPGEGITSVHMARLLSTCCDWLVTVDPHLHRHHALADIYTVPAKAVAAAPAIAQWISAHVARPLLVGPDEESAQWVSAIAALIGCEFIVMQKLRRGDSAVEVCLPPGALPAGVTPVLVDDIVSTAHTLAAAARALRGAGAAPPVCVVVHALFAPEAAQVLAQAGVAELVSCNTVAHVSNRIDVCAGIAQGIASMGAVPHQGR